MKIPFSLLALQRSVGLLLLLQFFCGSALCAGDIIAYTQTGEEVILQPDGTWTHKTKASAPNVKLALVGVVSLLRKFNTDCTVKFEIQNNSAINFKTFWPKASLVDANGYRFGTQNIQIGLRPGQKTIAEVQFSDAKCSDVAKIEIDSFLMCDVYDSDNKEVSYNHCEKYLAPLPGTTLPVVILKSQK
ncbi:hypothetical protein WDW86_21705 [Bdellovibrionota bacterium FG-2]